MSWLDKVSNQLVIRTGDGKSYSPNWINANLTTEYNVSQFEFPEVSGTLVQRRKPRGIKYSLEIMFQGDDHLETSEAFRISADDPRPWTVSHPFYGSITVQPLSLSFDNSKYNVTEIKGNVVETITQDTPKVTIDPVDKITEDKADTDDALSESFVNDVPVVDNETATLMTNQVATIYDLSSGNILNTLDAEEYFNLYNAANTAILNVSSDPLAAARAIQAFISYPAQFVDTVKNRVDLLVSQFQALSDTVSTITTASGKKTYEMTAATVISTMILASITDALYDSRNDVIAILDDILGSYDQYIEDLDSIQSDNGGEPDSYMANVSSLIKLNSLTNFALSSLFGIALDSKQERTLYLEDDSTVIGIAHRLYGLTEDDSSIDKIIANNQIQLNDLLLVRKGTKILYYV